MNCLHPYCPLSTGGTSADWSSVVDNPYLNLRKSQKADTLALLNANYGSLGVVVPAGITLPISGAALDRLTELCPCLFTQMNKAPTAKAIVHLCEVTLGERINDANVHDAYMIQHPKDGPDMLHPPILPYAGVGGTVMEFLCSEVLINEGIPLMQLSEGWPIWEMPGHVHLNNGRLLELKALGDILIPCAPTNIIISVKTEAARERLLYSANSIEGVGFGFFSDYREFHTPSRMALFKRMGFSAIYMPPKTYEDLSDYLIKTKTTSFEVNINGRPLYRPFTTFGEDMRRVVGKSSIAL